MLRITWESSLETDNSLIYDTHDSLTDIRDLYTEANKKLSSTVDKKDDLFIHTVELHELEKDTLYVYTCGGGAAWSSIHSFLIPKDSSNALNFAILGEAGNNEASSSALQLLSARNLLTRLTGIFDFTARTPVDSATLATLKANTPSFKVPDNIENDFVFTYNSIFFIFLNTREYN